jgi:hypothetical protein
VEMARREVTEEYWTDEKLPAVCRDVIVDASFL